MRTTFAARLVPLALAAALTLAMFASTSLLAGQQYRVAAAHVAAARLA